MYNSFSSPLLYKLIISSPNTIVSISLLLDILFSKIDIIELSLFGIFLSKSFKTIFID